MVSVPRSLQSWAVRWQLRSRREDPDPNSNGKLREIIAKAKANNVPNDNIDRAIKKAVADSDKSDFFEITYEGYGLGGIAVMVEALTDNRNRTAADVRHRFDKFGSSLTTSC